MTTAPPLPPEEPNEPYHYSFPPPPAPQKAWVKWFVGGVIVFVILLAITCMGVIWLSNGPSPKPSPTVTPAPTIATTGPSTSSVPSGEGTTNFTAPERQYLASIHKDPAFNKFPDSSLVDVGYTICDYLSSGGSVPEAEIYLTDNHGSPRLADELITGAASYLCPNQRVKL